LDKELTNKLISNWNATLTVIAQLMDIPVALVMSVDENKIQVFSKNDDENNPYNIDDSETLYGSGLYCEHVIKTQKPLEVVNALQDPKWCENPDIELDMIYYYGVPLNIDHKQVFGTLCVLDKKQRKIEPKFEALLNEIKSTFEMQLSIFNSQKQLLKQKSISNIDSLVWGMAHHLNTPIGTTITSLSIMKERIRAIEDSIRNKQLTMKQLNSQLSHINDSMQIADSSLKKAACLVDGYRDISIAQNEVIISNFNLFEFLSNCLKTKENQLLAFGVKVELVCDSKLQIATCQNLLSQVINQLLNNALVHAFDSKIESKEIKIEVIEHEASIQIKYHDNGKGIEQDIKEKVFDPFFTTDMNKGHGLGLSIVEKIINLQLNGKINLPNTLQGTFIEIMLPK